MELEGNRGQFVTGQSRRTWGAATVSLRLSILTGYKGRFGPKKAVLGHKMRSFGRAPPDLAPPPRGATGEFLAQNLDLARPQLRVHDDGAMRWSNGPNGNEKCLLACCCKLLQNGFGRCSGTIQIEPRPTHLWNG